MEHKSSLATETSEISLRLDDYDDIFSDFDIRSYSSRALSVDFLDEIKRASFDKEESGIELILYVPEKERNESREITIKERLAAHFRRHYSLLLEEKRRVRRLGISMVTMGILCIIVATFIVFKGSPSRSLFLSFLVVFLEPAAWFLLWEGMDQIIFNSKSTNADIEFHRKMSDSRGHTHFKSC